MLQPDPNPFFTDMITIVLERVSFDVHIDIPYVEEIVIRVCVHRGSSG
jgi:hypothetical protein